MDCIPTCIAARVSPKSHAFRVGSKDLVLEDSEEFICGTLAVCVVCITVKRRPREDAADPVFFNSTRGTPRRLLPDDEPREPMEPRGQPLRIVVRRVHADLPPPISAEPSKPRRACIRNSVKLARYGYTLRCIGCEAAVTQGPSRAHTEQCRPRIIKKPCLPMLPSLYESGMRTKDCHVLSQMQNHTRKR